MAKVTKSLRMDSELAERLDAYAKSSGQKLTALMEEWIAAGLASATGKPATPERRTLPQLREDAKVRNGGAAPHAGDLVPLAGTFDRAPLQKAPTRPKRWA